MKKFLKLAMLTVVMGVCGCSFNTDKSVEDGVDAKTITDVYLDATNAQQVSAQEAYSVYMDSCEKMENTDSITIVSDSYIGMGAETDSNQSVGTQTTTEEAEELRSDASSLTVIERVKTEDSFDVKLNMKRTLDGEEQVNIDGYFTDGYLYFNANEDKVKEAMGYADLMSMIGNYAYTIDEDMISEAAMLADKDDAVYFYKLDDVKMAEMMESNLQSAQYYFQEGDYVEAEYAGMKIRVNKEGIITEFTIGIKAIIHDQYGDTPVIYNIDTDFDNINATQVEKIEDLSSYIDSEQYMEQLQETTTEPVTEN